MLKKHLRELMLLYTKLKSLYNNDEYFRKLCESCNKKKDDDIEDEYIMLTIGNGRNILSEVPEETIDYEKNIYTIKLHNSNKTLIFKSVEEMINAGWAVD